MTKAKTKTKRLRVWIVFDRNGRCYLDNTRDTRRAAIASLVYDTATPWALLAHDGWHVRPATLTWTPPAKAKKRSAKR